MWKTADLENGSKVWRHHTTSSQNSCFCSELLLSSWFLQVGEIIYFTYFNHMGGFNSYIFFKYQFVENGEVNSDSFLRWIVDHCLDVVSAFKVRSSP